MAGIVVLILKIMPSSPDTNLNEIKSKALLLMEKEGAKSISFEEQPIAFDLKAVIMKMAFPEEKGTDVVEKKLAEIEHVSSVTIEDYRRAFG